MTNYNLIMISKSYKKSQFQPDQKHKNLTTALALELPSSSQFKNLHRSAEHSAATCRSSVHITPGLLKYINFLLTRFTGRLQGLRLQYEEGVKLCAAAAAVTPDMKPSQPEKSSALKQTTLQSSFTCAMGYEQKRAKWRDITKTVASHIAKDMLPVREKENLKLQSILISLDLLL